MHVYTPILHVLHLICKACDNNVRRKACEIFQTTYALQRLAASPWHLLQTVIAVWFLKTNFHAF